MNLADFTPHGFCLAWDPGLIWLQAGSDLLIALAYYSIPAALLVFLRRRTDLAFRGVFVLFAAFILACGTTHILSIVTLWQRFTGSTAPSRPLPPHFPSPPPSCSGR